MDEISNKGSLQNDVAACHPSSIGVHVLSGLPTQAVQKSFERVSEVMTVVPLNRLDGASLGQATQVGVLLPPFVEPSLLIESWLEGDFLQSLFGRPAHLLGISTFVDVGEVVDQIASRTTLSGRGWGQGKFDGRSVADIVVGQIESATHLVLVGTTPISEPLVRCLAVLNPQASRTPIREASPAEMSKIASKFDGSPDDIEGFDGDPTERQLQSSAPRTLNAPVVPPWLKVLQGEAETPAGLLVYRRARPFDPTRLRRWLADPPEGILRAKGRIWFASEPNRSYGYSCAGSVHRIFPAGRWWASCAEGEWPSDPSERQRLLERWHPRFGDRRQELVFAGVDVDAGDLFARLDTCLLAEEAIDDSLRGSTRSPAPPSVASSRVH